MSKKRIQPTRTAAEKKPVVLTFSASDPTCGAGLQADILAISAMGVHPLTVVTGITAQDTSGLHGFTSLSLSQLQQQTTPLLSDFQLNAFKSGALCSTWAVQWVASVAAKYPHIPLVADPVLATGRGDCLIKGGFIEYYLGRLLPHVAVLTPNVPELLLLSGKKQIKDALLYLFDHGVRAILLTGTHDETTGAAVVNRLYCSANEVHTFMCERLVGQFHGSGCTLASALAACLALGLPLLEAVDTALQFTYSALQCAQLLGQGQAIPDRYLGWAMQLASSSKDF
jgi:hydroxymethylpyrimidine/phosphomethylpyrimidine kinase